LGRDGERAVAVRRTCRDISESDRLARFGDRYGQIACRPVVMIVARLRRSYETWTRTLDNEFRPVKRT
jgi:hypothetical protein